ncbi:Beta-glucosidase [Archangium gephyra]|uniref:Beta-glucosidase n=2 Tax=Archangium gephyra TaxID=48 RepID=A0AAC8Q6B7_9BACT|nr:Beta-glucosidase [Archangium gephyra]
MMTWSSVAEAQSANVNLAYNQPTVTSSAEGPFAGSFAVDGDGGTRWGSGFNATEWIQVDLGQNTAVNRVVLTWEAAYGRGYTVQVSSDAVTWQNALVITAGDGGVDDLAVSGTGRYVRILCQARALPEFGYSLWEFAVYGTAAPAGDLAKNRPATASSVEANAAHLAPGFAFDANATTRWSSAAADPQWIRVDLGTSQPLGKVVLDWEGAYAKTYTVEGSNDDVNWTALAPTITNGAPGRRDIPVTGSARYVRMRGTERGTGYGYSLWSFEVYGPGGGPQDPPRRPRTRR